ncbi:hypothetical protein M514_06327 [Trichuris suis]|uniref:Uncharacterized protein n=1 Tax=Trichuris suis TaxID=68888 RepID=A0A085M6J0_9BILA|nr:hypothetical protein M513_06327 [Trichuris suis]KFD64922.1 hypothetical protein M514_06327 [Trichuris suis]
MMGTESEDDMGEVKLLDANTVAKVTYKDPVLFGVPHCVLRVWPSWAHGDQLGHPRKTSNGPLSNAARSCRQPVAVCCGGRELSLLGSSNRVSWKCYTMPTRECTILNLELVTALGPGSVFISRAHSRAKCIYWLWTFIRNGWK